MIKIILYLIKIYRYVECLFVKNITTILALYYIKALGGSIGKNVVCYGWPFFVIAKGSVVTIDDGSVLRSHYKGNAIGVNHKVIVRTSSSRASIVIGKRVGLSGTSICSLEKIVIGDDVLVGSNSVITDNDMHPIDPTKRLACSSALASAPVIIESNVWIGSGCFILKGVTIGENSVVGAGAVVTKSIPPNSLAAGVPAKVIKQL